MHTRASHPGYRDLASNALERQQLIPETRLALKPGLQSHAQATPFPTKYRLFSQYALQSRQRQQTNTNLGLIRAFLLLLPLHLQSRNVLRELLVLRAHVAELLLNHPLLPREVLHLGAEKPLPLLQSSDFGLVVAQCRTLCCVLMDGVER